jgi:hypothetical protein
LNAGSATLELSDNSWNCSSAREHTSDAAFYTLLPISDFFAQSSSLIHKAEFPAIQLDFFKKLCYNIKKGNFSGQNQKSHHFQNLYKKKTIFFSATTERISAEFA